MSFIDSFYRRISVSIAKLPLYNVQLAKMDIKEEHIDWFARCRLLYLNWFSQILIPFCVTTMAIFFSGHSASLYIFAAVTALYGSFALIKSRQDRKIDATERGVHLKNLNRVLLRLNLGELVQTSIFVFAILHAPQQYFAPLAAVCLFTYWMGAIALVSAPHIGFVRLILMSGALISAFLIRGGIDSILVAGVICGSFFGVYALCYNIYYMFATRRLRTRILRESNETVNLLLKDFDENASDWLWQTGREGSFIEPSQRFLESAAMDRNELENNSLSSLIMGGTEMMDIEKAMANRESFSDVAVPLCVNGEDRWWSISGQAEYRKDGEFRGYRGVAKDISDTKRAEAKINFLAHHDVLTGLPNRSMFGSMLTRALERCADERLIAVLYIDLDNFKAVNDTYGHPIGDKLLQETAARLENEISASDYASRLGGDEFAVMLTDLTDAVQAMDIANRITSAIDQTLLVKDDEICVGASIGIAVGPLDGDSAEMLLCNADLALYDAKARGRNGVSIFNEEMHQDMRQRRLLELDLRQALSRGELSLAYQPIVNIKENETIGYEALMRWNHPKRGNVSPETFIQLAEEVGLIVQLGEWALREALAEAARWPENLSVAVNVSPAQMQSASLLSTLMSALAETGVAPNRLELEITENVLIQDGESTLETLRKIQDLGVNISLDDFGTGYSSLNYLRSFPFNKIKIDRCFVSGLVERDQSKAIINAVIALASDLNMVTTAEGVETKNQLELLKGQGCSQVQGFLFSKAVPASELKFTKLAENKKLASAKVINADKALAAKKAKASKKKTAKPAARRGGNRKSA